MGHRPPKDYVQTEVREEEGLFTKAAGPVLASIIVAAIIGLNLNWRSDGVRDEVDRNIIKRVNELTQLVQDNTFARLKGERWTRSEALLKFDELELAITRLNLEIAVLKERRSNAVD